MRVAVSGSGTNAKRLKELHTVREDSETEEIEHIHWLHRRATLLESVPQFRLENSMMAVYRRGFHSDVLWPLAMRKPLDVL